MRRRRQAKCYRPQTIAVGCLIYALLLVAVYFVATAIADWLDK